MVSKSLNQILKSLTTVHRGDSVYRVASSERMNNIQDALRLLTRGDNLVSGKNILKRSADGYCVLSAQSRPGKGAAIGDEFPFEVLFRNNPDTGMLEFGVVSNSHLFNTEDRDVYEEPNDAWGLLSDDEETGWFGGGSIDSGTIGDKIYLRIELAENDQSILAIDVVFGPVGGADWTFYPDPIGIADGAEGPYQKYYYQLIAEITNPEEDPRPGEIITVPFTDPPESIQLTQLLFDNVVMTTGHTTLDADDPHMPLLVAIPTNWPGTDIDGLANPIPPDDNMMTPYQFGDVFDVNDYSFKMLDATTTDDSGTHFRVLILDGDVINESDGSRHTPSGMGADDYVLSINDNGDEVWLVVPHDNEYNVVEPVTLDTGATTPDDTALVSYITIGQVFIDFTDTPARLTPHNTVCGDVLFSPPSERKSQRYSFQMIDASDDSGVKVLIIDGDVVDQHDNPHTPSGMGGDDYIISIPYDHAEVYLVIPHDNNWDVVPPVTIDVGEMPSDTATIHYERIGYVTFNTSVTPATGDPHNQLCGDFFFDGPLDVSNSYSFKLVDASSGTTARIRVLDGEVIDEEGNAITPTGMGGDNVVFVCNDGESVYLEIDYDQVTGEVLMVTPHIDSVTPADSPEKQYVTIGKVYIDNTDPAYVIGVNHICGDYFFSRELDSVYSFQLFPASSADGPRVRITDGDIIDAIGSVHTPNGMGNDDLLIDVAFDDEIWVKVPRNRGDNVITGLCEIQSGPNTPDDTNEFAYFTIGYPNVDGNWTHPHNNILGDIFLDDTIPQNLYSFQMIDASDATGFRVRIIDGDVTDPTGDEPITPAGMGNDDFTIGVYDLAEIWLGFTYNTTNNRVTSAWIQVGEVTSGDGVEGALIGYVNVDEGILRPHNVQCGDYFFDPGLDVTGDFTNTNTDNVVSNVDQMNFIGAVGIEHDPGDVNPNAVDVTIGTYVSDDEGHQSFSAWGIEFDGAATLSDERDPDNDNIGFATVKVGPFVSDGAGGYRDTVWGMEFENATIWFEDDANGTAFATINVAGGMSVQGDTGFVDSVDHIQFTVADDPSAGFIEVVAGTDEGVAIVKIPVIPVSPGTGVYVLGDDGGDTHWFGTSVCP